MKSFFGFITALVVLAATVVSAHASEAYWKLYEKRYEISVQVRSRTGSSHSDLTIERGPVAGSYKLRLYDYKYNTVEIVLSNVTDENLERKTAEAIELLVAEVKIQQGRENAVRDFQRDVNSASQSEDYALERGMGVTVGGAPMYFSVWIEVAGTKPKDAAGVISNGRSRWLRTTFALDGREYRNDELGSDALAVARVSTTLWQIDSARVDSIRTTSGVIKLATVHASYRTDGVKNGNDAMRLDVDFVSMNIMDSVGDVSWAVRPFYVAAMALGMRLIDESKALFAFNVNFDYRLGLMIGNRVYVAGRFGMATDIVRNSRRTLGVEAGWAIAPNFLLKASVEHNTSLGEGDDEKTVYDRMYLVPTGWTINGGMLVKF